MKKKILFGIIILFMTILVFTGCQLKSKNDVSSSSASKSTTSVISTSDIFTDRDLEQDIDISDATTYDIEDNKNVTIDSEGIFVISGTAKNVSIIVDADDEDKIQLVLKDVTITNSDMPCVYVKNADKVFITTMSTNSLSVTGTFTSDGETSTDAVIFSRDDVVFNGNGSLTIQSSDNGISSKDDIKITGGTITINCVNDALEAHEMIAVAGGNLTIKTSKDGFHAEYDDNDTVGSVYIQGGVIQIDAGDDGIHAITNLVIDGGTIDIKAKEGLEGTYIQINGGSVNISASDDGVNAAQKSKAFTATFEMNGGELTINMGAGDTDAIDSNGNLYVNGGTVTITAQSPFDYDGEGKYTGGTMIINGEETTTITNQMMGGPGGHGGRGRSR